MISSGLFSAEVSAVIANIVSLIGIILDCHWKREEKREKKKYGNDPYANVQTIKSISHKKTNAFSIVSIIIFCITFVISISLAQQIRIQIEEGKVNQLYQEFRKDYIKAINQRNVELVESYYLLNPKDNPNEYKAIVSYDSENREDIYEATSNYINNEVVKSEIIERQGSNDDNILFGYHFENKYNICEVNGYEITEVSTNGSGNAKYYYQVINYVLEKNSQGDWKFTRMKANDIRKTN